MSALLDKLRAASARGRRGGLALVRDMTGIAEPQTRSDHLAGVRPI